MHRNYPEWTAISKKTWGPVTVKEAVEDIQELIRDNDELRRYNASGVSVGGHHFTGTSSAINTLKEWEHKASIYNDTVKHLRDRVKELEDGSRVKELENKIIAQSIQISNLKRELESYGVMP